MLYSARIIAVVSLQCCLLSFPNFLLCAETSETRPHRKISLIEAIKESVENNSTLKLSEAEAAIAKEEIRRAESFYDTVVSSELSGGKEITPSASVIAGSSVSVSDRRASLGLSQGISTGAEIRFSAAQVREKNTSLFQALSPEWRSTADLTLSQPLLKGAWSGSPERVVDIARSFSDSAGYRYQTEYANQIRNVVFAYWNKVLKDEVVLVKQRSLSLAKRLLQEATQGVKIGSQAPLAKLEAEAQVALRLDELLQAESAAKNASDTLALVLGEDPYALGNVEYLPQDRPRYFPFEYRVEPSIKEGLELRPEVQAALLALSAAEKEVKLAENRALPEINLLGRAGVDGLAGQTKDSFDGENPFPGDETDSLDELLSGDYYTYGVGLQFKHSIQSSSEKADLEQKKLKVTQARSRLYLIRQEIAREVRDAGNSLNSAVQRISASSIAKTASDQALEKSEERFKAGLSTTREVLELQEDNSESELALIQALVDFRNAVARCHFARGTLRQYYGL